MQPSRTRTGFTLIELLTVIAIIAILMGLLLPALNAAKNAARKSQAKNDLTQLVTAVKAFYTDYGVYPIDPSSKITGNAQDVEYGDKNGGGSYPNSDVINVLRADPGNDVLSTGTTPLSINTRQQVYLDVPFVKDPTNPKSGLGTGTEANSNVKAPGNWYDPWGYTYIVCIDSNYDGYTDAQQGTNTGLGNYTDLSYITNLNGTTYKYIQDGCIAGSYGADHVCGTVSNANIYNGSDDVLSWQ
jgi:prepilin-type N-terminal cleavage/methylation domain-containing protein